MLESVIALLMHIINGSHDRAYYEQPRIVHQRHVYLRRMRQNRTDDYSNLSIFERLSGVSNRL